MKYSVIQYDKDIGEMDVIGEYQSRAEAVALIRSRERNPTYMRCQYTLTVDLPNEEEMPEISDNNEGE